MPLIYIYIYNTITGLTFMFVLKTPKFLSFSLHMNTYKFMDKGLKIKKINLKKKTWPMHKFCVIGSAVWSVTFDCWLWWEWTMFVSVNLHALFHSFLLISYDHQKGPMQKHWFFFFFWITAITSPISLWRISLEKLCSMFSLLYFHYKSALGA